MDQGTAAVLGACVGVAGTLGTGVLAYFAARHQIRDQAKLEHKKTVRSERREAYRNYLITVSEIERDLDLFMLKLVKLKVDQEAPEVWLETFSESTSLSDRLKDLKAQSTDLLLAGPAELALLAGPIIAALNNEWKVLTMAGIEFKWEEEEEEKYEQARSVSGVSISDLGMRASIILNMEVG
ncbi:hypothetical protein ACWD3I_06300 [Streptomyces sp. NPDC002817]|uniref:hypothetical protein n=1 Tax=Streptomyces sp. NPDC088357 TaxID=3154655 RepID=UPI003449CA33